MVIDPRTHEDTDENYRGQQPFHFAITWEGSKKRSVLTVLDQDALKAHLKKAHGKKGKGKGKGKGAGGQDDPFTPRAMEEQDNQKYVPILALDCRGIEPYAFHPMGSDFIVQSEGSMTFDDDVDLRDGDWAEYDDVNDIALTITDFQSKIDNV